MGSGVLGGAISAIRDWSQAEAKQPRGPHASETFGSLVFNDLVQQQRLPPSVYQKLRRTITHGDLLDLSVADEVIVLARGRVMGQFSSADADLERVTQLVGQG